MKKRPELAKVIEAYFQDGSTNKYTYLKTEQKDVITRIIREEMKACYPQKHWDDLTEFEQDSFVCVHIRKRMLQNVENYLGQQFRKRIERKIDNKSKRLLLGSPEAVKRYNEKVEGVYDVYDTSAMSEQEAKESYKKFCCVVKRVISGCTVPSYEEWREWTRTGTVRPYDVLKTFEEEGYTYENYAPENEGWYLPTESEVDHVAFRALLKYLSKTQGIEMDFPGIEKCLTYVSTYTVVEYFDSLNPDVKEDCQFLEAMERLQNLDFVFKLDEK